MAANVRDRFDSGGIVAIRERPESARLRRHRALGRRSLGGTDSSRSGLAVGTGLHAPLIDTASELANRPSWLENCLR